MYTDRVKNQIFVLTLKYLMPNLFYFSGVMTRPQLELDQDWDGEGTGPSSQDQFSL